MADGLTHAKVGSKIKLEGQNEEQETGTLREAASSAVVTNNGKPREA